MAGKVVQTVRRQRDLSVKNCFSVVVNAFNVDTAAQRVGKQITTFAEQAQRLDTFEYSSFVGAQNYLLQITLLNHAG
jgi:hypothetical protein